MAHGGGAGHCHEVGNGIDPCYTIRGSSKCQYVCTKADLATKEKVEAVKGLNVWVKEQVLLPSVPSLPPSVRPSVRPSVPPFLRSSSPRSVPPLFGP